MVLFDFTQRTRCKFVGRLCNPRAASVTNKDQGVAADPRYPVGLSARCWFMMGQLQNTTLQRPISIDDQPLTIFHRACIAGRGIERFE